jgi:hypothetical protein
MKIYEDWIRAHLPGDLPDQDIDFFNGYYLDGLTVMAEGERGGPDTVVYEAKDEEDLCYWQLKVVCKYVEDGKPREKKTWRYYRDHAENGRWLYVEHRHYDYNAIDDPRLYGFEHYLRNLKAGFPPGRWEEEVQGYVRLMNAWYDVPHWDYDRENLCFIEISGSKEHDGDHIEEPRPGSVIRVVD